MDTTLSPAAASSVTVRVLPKAEWPRLLDPAIVSPFAAYGLPQGDGWRIIVAERDGQIVGLSCLYDAVHWDGWWFREDLRQNSSAVRQMLRVGRAELQAAGASGVFALIDDTASEGHRAMVERLGFERAKGDLYLLDLDRLPKEL